jgi:hypothetical protein
MPQAIKLNDSEGRSCIYVPITQDGKVVDSPGYTKNYDELRMCWSAGRPPVEVGRISWASDVNGFALGLCKV